MSPSMLALLLTALAVPGSTTPRQPVIVQIDERADLQHALDSACRQFSHDDQSLEADRCRRDFFSAHEEAIWRLNVNPHRTQTGPSS